MTATRRSRTAVVAVLASVGLASLAGCSGDPDDAATGEFGGSPAPASSAAPAEENADTTIRCAQIAPLAAPITKAFTFSADDSAEDPSSTSCVWTNAAVGAASTKIEDYATLGITLDRTAWSKDDLASVPGATDDPRAAALGGRVLLKAQADTLGDAGSVQVLFPEGTVTVVATGALLSASKDTSIPVDSVIGVATAVAQLRR
ncbi:hypothetical protein FJK98_16930 [Micromonospora sp. HM134]|uniref:hypothetical protein n=1 Tax=unclassified Micromonospora TaxID=2617518 RepID=UPI001198A3FA|nr:MULTISPECIES: hypothetical protein [unclassified Micromonospora]QDY08621.1 hypothetical protein FJK98_16930 [Micromonospora sp. HM134]